MITLTEGIYINDDGIITYDKESDRDIDVLSTLTPDIYKADFLGNSYYFGYVFKDGASRSDRTAVIRWIKNLDDSGISENDLRHFIDKPLSHLSKQENISEFKCLLYPRSNRSNLTKTIVNEVYKFTQHDMTRVSFEFVKNIPSEIYFDWDAFDADYSGTVGDNQYNQIHSYIEDTLMPKIHDLTYFSLAAEVKPKYRQYIKNYLVIDDKTKSMIRDVQSGKVLIVDDINTSGSTLAEMLRIVHRINNQCEVYIFTLIGKDYI